MPDQKTSESQRAETVPVVPNTPRRARKALPPGNPLAHCTATTADGRPCPARPMSGSDRRYQHSEDPATAEHRAVSRRLGGINATHQRFLGADAAPPVLEHPEGVRALLADTIQQVRTGQLPPAAANAVVYAVGTALKLAELELSAKVAKLEQAMLDRGRRG
jgi:hypothetical protein